MTIHGGRRIREDAGDFVLDAEFGFVGELVAVVAEDLDAVVLPGIVAGGDDDASGEAVLAGEEGDGGGGDDAGEGDVGTGGVEAGGQGGGDPAAALAGVGAHDDADGVVRFGELCREGDADCVDGALVQRRNPGDRSNSVCSKQLPHADP